ncbi:Peptidoglycan/LPS O-acetylase OafA/YrhL, contains acyltransferase and SGNH-hydrolase domains [Chitinophaga rupis]|uniref:Peptidoglycan/LPS O-acetylase OafA/YrhL, contains acyltransferase and SGNH-hydrolase domains n=1 Tax=Chitinophaga rupis TaxID=573321 RepID=A0A1H7Y8X7_9BACT|nr:acyltransferase [Chitinophaga rupis]SEM42453.1 Peptidoglycan/LPS O-acetylase OafA/YrhL, contains acyltransferase and SGNH-hydrolase domains [Chitinophaga rupis]
MMKTLSLHPVKTQPVYLYTLDIIRAVSAFIVIFAHWQFFYYTNDVYTKNGYDPAALPGYQWLSLIYDHSMVVVDLFFLLSGFIFFWLYAEKVSSGKISFGKFMWFRITRLYPIHFVSLLLVALLQFLMLRNAGHYFIIQYNDVYHFFLNLLFMQNWGLEKGPSFNGPSWSASVEVFLYIIFFTTCRLHLQRRLGVLALLMPAGLLVYCFYDLLGKGIFSFFEGALVYYAYKWIVEENRIRQQLPWIAAVTILLFTGLLVTGNFSPLSQIVIRLLQQVAPGRDEAFYLSAPVIAGRVFFRSIIAPLIILTLVLWGAGSKGSGKRWAWLGSSSYAMYLLHFPLQITFVLITDYYGISRTVYHSPYTILLFFTILLPLSVAAHYGFEYPVQEKLRSRLFRKAKQPISIAEPAIISQ